MKTPNSQHFSVAIIMLILVFILLSAPVLGAAQYSPEEDSLLKNKVLQLRSIEKDRRPVPTTPTPQEFAELKQELQNYERKNGSFILDGSFDLNTDPAGARPPLMPSREPPTKSKGILSVAVDGLESTLSSSFRYISANKVFIVLLFILGINAAILFSIRQHKKRK